MPLKRDSQNAWGEEKRNPAAKKRIQRPPKKFR
jgi:hypothetical protein